MLENSAKKEALKSAKKVKNDEFYTLIEDVEKEMIYYRHYFEGKTLLLNCDDPEQSSFWKYFSLNFDFLGLKGLISTHYVGDKDVDEKAYMLRYDTQHGTNEERVTKRYLKGNGDFRSDECIELLKEADIVITNPPFSLWREFLETIFQYEKQFLILGNFNAITYAEVYPLIKENKLWLGVTRQGSGSMWFRVPKNAPDKTGQRFDNLGNKYQTIGNTAWFTNLEHQKRHEEIILTKFYEGNEADYPIYDNYPAIEVSRIKDLPIDYTGVMGVPITFIGKYNPDQFEIIKFRKGEDDKDLHYNGKSPFFRILIKNKKPISKKDVLGF